MAKNSKSSKKSNNRYSGSNPVSLRAGRLNYQSYTTSSRTPSSIEPSKGIIATKKSKYRLVLVVVIAVMVGLAYSHLKTNKPPVVSEKTSQSTKTVLGTTDGPRPASSPAASFENVCATNKLPQLAFVSISQRRMWACQGPSQVYTSAVVTGMENYPADLTPTGTYTISSKQKNLYLDGSDSTGTWHDYVYYWMPFLQNDYGSYGFHDATWRAANAFGNISPYSNQASHGCVEMPLAAAAWLFNWIQVGSTVIIQA